MKFHPESLVNSIAVSLCGILVLTITLPSIARHRAAARSQQCINNMKQLGLGIHNYHSAYNTLPAALGGTEGNTERLSNQRRLGPLVGLLPFMEQQALWETISNPHVSSNGTEKFPPMGPAPWIDPLDYEPWSRAPSVYACPDDLGGKADNPKQSTPIVVTTFATPPAILSSLSGSLFSKANYVACYGDGTLNLGSPGKKQIANTTASRYARRPQSRGFFMPEKANKFRDILDGLSNTVMFSEAAASPGRQSKTAGGISNLAKNPSLCLATADREDLKWLALTRGSRWCDGALAVTGFQTVLPPNAPSCSADMEIDNVIVSASSLHAGGVNVLMGDGRVGFVSETIDCGDSRAPGVANEPGYGQPGSPSPYGLWGAIGTRACKETIHGSPFLASGRPSLFGNLLDTNTRPREGQNGYRKWTASKDNKTMLAKLNRIIDQQTAELLDDRGVTHRIPLNTLSDEDIYIAVRTDLANRKSELGN